MTYFLTYLLAFMRFDLSSWQQIVAIVIVCIVLAVIYVNSELIFTNPTLALFGYRIFGCLDDQGNEIIVLTRRRDFRAQSKVDLHIFGNGLAVEAG